PRSALAEVLGRVSPQPQDRRFACRSGLSARPAGNRLHRGTKDHDVSLRRGGAAPLTPPPFTGGTAPFGLQTTVRPNHPRAAHEFRTGADGTPRAFGRVAVPSRHRGRAIGGGAENRAARTPDRVAAAAAQGNSGRARPNAKEDRESRGEGRSRAAALFGPAAH